MLHRANKMSGDKNKPKHDISSWRLGIEKIETQGINTMSLSDITGIPRPTVIRKLKSLIQDHLKETNSAIAKEILDDFENKINNFKQVCPVEMLDKLENPITLKGSISKAV